MFSFYNYSTVAEAIAKPSTLLPPLLKKDSHFPVIFQCGQKSLLGGYQIFGSADSSTVIRIDLPIDLNIFPSHYKFTFHLLVYEFSVNPSQMLKMAQTLKATDWKFLNFLPKFINTETPDNSCGNTKIFNFSIYISSSQNMRNTTFFLMIYNQTTPPTSYGYYGFRELSIVIKLCHPTCAVCSSPTSCIECVLNAKKNISSGFCYCPDGFYWTYCPNSKPCNYKCNKCPENCTLCNSTQCLTCISNHFLTLDGVCSTTCPSNNYINGVLCKKCDSSCERCSGPSNIECLTCTLTMVLYKGSCISIDYCPDSTYISIKNLQGFEKINCIDCDKTCQTCLGPYNSDCSSCSDTNQFINNGFCVDSCPLDKSQNETNKLCIKCHESCSRCYGSESNQCLLCSDPHTYLAENNTCASKCGSGKFPNNLSICESCGSYCDLCTGRRECGKCLEGGFFFNETLKKCFPSLKLYAYIKEIENPTVFLITFTQSWDYIEKNYKEIFLFSLQNNTKLSFSSQIIKPSVSQNMTPGSFLVIFRYNGSIELIDSFFMTISVKLNYTQTNFQYNLMSNSTYFSIPLRKYLYCKSNEYYNSTTNAILKKPIISAKLSYTSDPLTFTIKFVFPSTDLSYLVRIFSKISIEGFTSSQFNYTIVNFGQNTFTVELIPYKLIVLKPRLWYSLNLPNDYILLNNLDSTTANDSIPLLDYYLLSEVEKSQISMTKSQMESTEYISQGSSAVGTILASGNPLFIQGVMLSQMIFLMKYTKIEFPPNLDAFFKKNSLPRLIFFYVFEITIEDEEVLPAEFIKDKISPFFLDNCGEFICKNAALIIFAMIILIITEKNKNKNCIMKLLNLIRRVLIWELILIFFLETLLKFSFFTMISLMYPAYNSHNGRINYAISCVFLIFSFLFLLHIFLVIRKCQNIKRNDSHNLMQSNKITIFMSPKQSEKEKNQIQKTEIEENTTMKDAKLMKSSNVFSELLSPNLKDCSNSLSPELKNNSKILNKYDEIFLKIPKELEPMTALTPTSPPIISSNNISNVDDDNMIKNKQTLSKVAFDTDINKEENLDMIKENEFENTKTMKFSPVKFRKTLEPTNSEYLKPPPAHKTFNFRLGNFQLIKYLYNPNKKDYDQYLKEYMFLHEEITIIPYIRYFIMFDYLRQTIICVMIVVIRSSPLAQLVLINLFNIAFILWFVIYKPFLKRYSFFFALINELITETAFIAVLGLAIMDYTENGDIEKRMNLGWVVITVNLALLYWLILNSVANIAIKIYTKIRNRRKIFGIKN